MDGETRARSVDSGEVAGGLDHPGEDPTTAAAAIAGEDPARSAAAIDGAYDPAAPSIPAPLPLGRPRSRGEGKPARASSRAASLRLVEPPAAAPSIAGEVGRDHPAAVVDRLVSPTPADVGEGEAGEGAAVVDRLVSPTTAAAGPSIPRSDGGAVEREWSPADRATAFEVWLLRAGRNLKHTAALLAGEGYNLPIPYATLWRWHRADTWDIAGDERLTDLVPSLRARSLQLGDVAGVEAMAYIVGCLSGARDPDPKMTAVAKLGLESAGLIGGRAAAAVSYGAIPAVVSFSRPLDHPAIAGEVALPSGSALFDKLATLSATLRSAAASLDQPADVGEGSA